MTVSATATSTVPQPSLPVTISTQKRSEMLSHLYLPAKAAAVEDHDLSSFVDLSSFSPSSGLGLPFQSASATAFSSHELRFESIRLQDALLDSPLGLSPDSLNASPFDLSFDSFDASPLSASSSSPFMGTPDLLSSSDALMEEYPSLFGPSFAAPITTSPNWEPRDLVELLASQSIAPPAAPQLLATTSATMSPALLSLDHELASLPALPLPPLVSPAPPATTSTVNDVAVVDSKDKKTANKKEKFNGTRNTKKPMIDFDSPTLPKSYVIPGKTTRKRAPSPLSNKVLGSPNEKRARREFSLVESVEASTPASTVEAADLPEEVLSAIEEKRRSNTLAARKSRIRKADHLKDLNDRIAEQAKLILELQAENAALRAQI